MSRRKYRTYDYEEIFDKSIFGEETLQEKIDELGRDRKKCRYKVRTIVCGDYQEVEIFPVYERNKDIPRLAREKISKASQEKLNHKKSQKQLARVINTNFVAGDLAIDLTYAGDHIPTLEEAQRDIKNYIARVRRWRKKRGLAELKYVYVIEFMGEDEKGNSKKVRIHHHMIMSSMDRDEAERLWGKGRANTDRLQPDENGFVGKGMYFAKHCQKKGMKKWVGSKNLEKPKVYESVTKLTRRKVSKIALQENDWKEIFEKLYKNKYQLNSCERYISKITGGCYLYARMVRRI